MARASTTMGEQGERRQSTGPVRERPHTANASSSGGSGSRPTPYQYYQRPPPPAPGTSIVTNVGDGEGRGSRSAARSRMFASRDDLGATFDIQPRSLDSGPLEPPMQISTNNTAAASRPRRKSSSRFLAEAQNTALGEGSVQKTSSLRRRLSRSSKVALTSWREGLMRRASTPNANNGNGSSNVAQPPTSPSKRPGRHEDTRPTKLHLAGRLQLGKGDRKDTPAPLTGTTNPLLPQSRELTGGHHARLAAGMANTKTYHAEPGTWDGQQALNQRRASIGSLSSAADSGADLSSYAGSNSDQAGTDADNMIVDEMMPDAPPVAVLQDPHQVFPTEIFLQVLENLDAKDIARAEQVSQSWNNEASRNSLWRTAFNQKFGRKIYTDPAPILVGGAGVGRPNQPNQHFKRMYHARVELEKNWRKGVKDAGKAIYLAGHTDSVYCLQFDEDKIITGSRDRTIRVWDINNFTCQRVIGGPDVKPVTGPKVLRTVDYPDFHLATASVNGSAYGDTIYHTPPVYHSASILCLQYDDKILVTGSSDSSLLVWDINTYEPLKRLSMHTGGVLDVALDAKHIVSCSKDSRIIVWDRETYEARGELTGHRGPVNAVQLRGNLLVSASGDGIARLWDLNTMRLIKQFNAKERGLAAVEFSEDMRYVLAGGNDTITYKFDRNTGAELTQYRGHTQLVRSLWLDSQNNRVVSGSYDLDLRVYDFATGQELWRAEEWTTSWMLAAKSDYRRIVATSQDGRILIVDFGLQKCVKVDDGQPIKDVDLLRGTDSTNVIQWRDPWQSTRDRDAAVARAAGHAVAGALKRTQEDSGY